MNEVCIHNHSKPSRRTSYKMNAYLCIEMEAIDTVPVVEIISRVVLATRRDLKLEVSGLPAIRLLEPSDVGGCVLAGHRRILAGGFLPSAPPRVPEYVHIGAPVRQAGLP